MKRLALILLLAAAQAAADPMHDWIMSRPETIWCCRPNHDCMPVPGRIRVGPDGWSVEGWTGALRDGDRGFYRNVPQASEPWACHHPGTTKLRCIFLGEAGL